MKVRNYNGINISKEKTAKGESAYEHYRLSWSK